MTWIFDSVPPATAPKDTANTDKRRDPPCPACCGEGFIETIGGPGYFSEFEECWMPSADVEPCSACRGTGVKDHDEPDDPTSAEERHRSSDHPETVEDAESALPF